MSGAMPLARATRSALLSMAKGTGLVEPAFHEAVALRAPKRSRRWSLRMWSSPSRNEDSASSSRALKLPQVKGPERRVASMRRFSGWLSGP